MGIELHPIQHQELLSHNFRKNVQHRTKASRSLPTRIARRSIPEARLPVVSFLLSVRPPNLIAENSFGVIAYPSRTDAILRGGWVRM